MTFGSLLPPCPANVAAVCPAFASRFVIFSNWFEPWPVNCIRTTGSFDCGSMSARVPPRFRSWPVISGVALHPGKRMSYGVVPGEGGRVAHHVFHLPPSPIAALTVASLLIGPLIARLQGGGGHRQAAGFSSEQPVEEITEFIREQYRRAAKGS